MFFLHTKYTLICGFKIGSLYVTVPYIQVHFYYKEVLLYWIIFAIALFFAIFTSVWSKYLFFVYFVN